MVEHWHYQEGAGNKAGALSTRSTHILVLDRLILIVNSCTPPKTLVQTQ